MQIFVTSKCPYESAKALDNIRLNKMILESAQLLSNAFGGPYKKTHLNHPCTKWLLASDKNIWWLMRHLEGLYNEWTRRKGKSHLAYLKYQEFINSQVNIEHYSQLAEPDDFCNCTPYKELEVTLAYMHYLNDKWDSDSREPSWD